MHEWNFIGTEMTAQKETGIWFQALIVNPMGKHRTPFKKEYICLCELCCLFKTGVNSIWADPLYAFTPLTLCHMCPANKEMFQGNFCRLHWNYSKLNQKRKMYKMFLLLQWFIPAMIEEYVVLLPLTICNWSYHLDWGQWWTWRV